MRHRFFFLLIAASLLFVSPLLIESALSQGGGGGGAGAPAGGGGGGAAGGGGGGGGQRGGGAPPAPAPRNADGRVLLSGVGDGAMGIWTGAFGGMGGQPWVRENVPLQPWALALYENRQPHELEPHARCRVSGITRQHQTPYGVEFTEFPELSRIYMFDVGGPHTYRIIYMDRKSHPDADSYVRNGYGHSIGWWENNDTLVVETTHYDEGFWLDRRGIPHTDQLRTVERFTRTTANQMVHEITFHDPLTYTEPWTGRYNLSFSATNQLFEYVCQQGNHGMYLMVGSDNSYLGVERSNVIVP